MQGKLYLYINCEQLQLKSFICRRGTIRVLGLLGALDPYKHKMHLGQIDVEGNAAALVSMTDPKSDAESVQGMLSFFAVLMNIFPNQNLV